MKEQGLVDGPFGVGGIGRGKIEVAVGVSGLGEVGNGERVGGEVNDERDIEDVDRGVRDVRSKLERRLNVRKERHEGTELSTGEAGASTISYVAIV